MGMRFLLAIWSSLAYSHHQHPTGPCVVVHLCDGAGYGAWALDKSDT